MTNIKNSVSNAAPNPIRAPLDDLLKRLNFLNGVLFHLQSHLKNFQELFMERLQRDAISIERMGTGIILNIRDITEWPPSGWQNIYPTGGYASRGEEYLLITDVILSRVSALTISQAYETFETFLMDIVSVYLYHNRDAAEQKKLSKHRSGLTKDSLSPDDIEYWKKFVRLAYRNSPTLLEFIRRLAPELKEVERKNNHQINFDEWFEVFTEVRHAVTHSNMIMKHSTIHTWSRIKQNLLNHFFPGTTTSSSYELHLTQEITDEDLTRLAEYAFAIFKALSKTKHYDWAIFQTQVNK